MSGATTPSESDGTMGSDDDDIDNWLEKHMPPWLIEALRSWPERWPDDAKYQSEKAARNKMKKELKEQWDDQVLPFQAHMPLLDKKCKPLNAQLKPFLHVPLRLFRSRLQC